MKVIVKHPGEPVGHYEEIENSLHAFQEKVGGFIETVDFGVKAVLICDEEGMIRGKKQNFYMDTEHCRQWIHGTVIICGLERLPDGDLDFCDVPLEVHNWELNLLFWGNETETEEKKS